MTEITNGATLQRLEEADFGKLPDGRVVKSFTLRNAQGMTARVITYGAIITELLTPDKNGMLTNVVLGTNNLDRYLKGFSTPAAIMGRVANRISKARFSLDGVEYKLKPNDGPNHIHGVFGGVLWQATPLPPSEKKSGVQLTYFSKDGEDGYPGNLTAKVTYSLTDANELQIDYEATTDKATPLNLTSHAYFNLRGYGDVYDHVLWLASNRYTPTDDAMIPTGQIAAVKDTPLDFTSPTPIGSRINQLKPRPGGYDNNFILEKAAGPLAVVARVREPSSGRLMELRTTEPAVQLYTANHFHHAALCLETQHYPDSVNQPAFPSTILRPGEKFQSTTIYAFSVGK